MGDLGLQWFPLLCFMLDKMLASARHCTFYFSKNIYVCLFICLFLMQCTNRQLILYTVESFMPYHTISTKCYSLYSGIIISTKRCSLLPAYKVHALYELSFVYVQGHWPTFILSRSTLSAKLVHVVMVGELVHFVSYWMTWMMVGNFSGMMCALFV